MINLSPVVCFAKLPGVWLRQAASGREHTFGDLALRFLSPYVILLRRMTPGDVALNLYCATELRQSRVPETPAAPGKSDRHAAMPAACGAGNQASSSS